MRDDRVGYWRGVGARGDGVAWTTKGVVFQPLDAGVAFGSAQVQDVMRTLH